MNRNSQQDANTEFIQMSNIFDPELESRCFSDANCLATVTLEDHSISKEHLNRRIERAKTETCSD